MKKTQKNIRGHQENKKTRKTQCLYLLQCNKYPIENHICYENFSNKHKTFLTKISEDKEPKNYTQASKQIQWQKAMKNEINTLKENNTWKIIEIPKETKTIGCK